MKQVIASNQSIGQDDDFTVTTDESGMRATGSRNGLHLHIGPRYVVPGVPGYQVDISPSLPDGQPDLANTRSTVVAIGDEGDMEEATRTYLKRMETCPLDNIFADDEANDTFRREAYERRQRR